MKYGTILYLLLTITVLAGFVSCQKSGTNCMTSAGSVTKERRDVPDFDSIDVGDYVNLILSQDSANHVDVESGENIIDGITTTVANRQLTIRNTNICNWLRTYNIPVNVYISVKNLKKIYYNSSGNVKSLNALKSHSLTLEVWGGCGSIDLDLDIYEGFFVLQMGTVDFNLHGHCSINSIYSGDYGFFQCKNLSTGYTFITNNGSNDCYIRASQYLDATIGSIGNIYYSGTPDSLLTHIYGEGRVIPY